MSGKLVRFAKYASGRDRASSHSQGRNGPPPSRGAPGGDSRRGPPADSQRPESSSRSRSHTHSSNRCEQPMVSAHRSPDYGDYVRESRHGSSRTREGSLVIAPTSQNGASYRPSRSAEDPVITRDGSRMRVRGERDQHTSHRSTHRPRALIPRERDVHGGAVDARLSRLGLDDQPSRSSGRTRAMTHHGSGPPTGSMDPRSRQACDLPHSHERGDSGAGVRVRVPAAALNVTVNVTIVQL